MTPLNISNPIWRTEYKHINNSDLLKYSNNPNLFRQNSVTLRYVSKEKALGSIVL